MRLQEAMLNEQLDLPDASRAGIAAVSERLKDLQWDSPGEHSHRSHHLPADQAAAATVATGHADDPCTGRSCASSEGHSATRALLKDRKRGALCHKCDALQR